MSTETPIISSTHDSHVCTHTKPKGETDIFKAYITCSSSSLADTEITH